MSSHKAANITSSRQAPRKAGRLLLICALSLLAGCTNRKSDIEALMSKTSVQEDRATGVTIIYSKGGKVEARLFSKTFIRNEVARPPYVDLKDGLKAEFYGDSLRLTNTLTAGSGRWYEREGNIVLRDSVKVVNDKGEMLRTDELVWNEKLREFYTDKPVKITTATQIISGIGMESNQDFSWYRIKNITGAVAVEKSSLPE